MNELTTEFPYELEKDIKFIKEIDHGAFGKVIHAYETKNNLDLAIKVINKGGMGPNLINEMKEEISILKKLDHNNIVKCYGYSETNNQILIKMEYIKYGTLSKYLKSKPKINEQDASIILSAVLSAVEYLHSKHICHRDIKPENIMFSEENNLSSIKIIDFGLSAQHFNYLTNNNYCGTFIHMAPEQIEKKLYTYSVDIWSIGILMYMLLNNGKHPFYQKNDKKEDFIQKIKKGKLYFLNKLSFMAKHLNKKLCEINPSWRYSANLAIKHPWITRNPNDEIPLTFNEILMKNNCKKDGSYLLMICIFLNYYKKKEINMNEREKIADNNFYMDNFIKKKNNKLFYITKKYINKGNAISLKQKEKYLKQKEKYLEIISTDEEDYSPETEKKQNLIKTKKTKRTSIKKNVKFSVDFSSQNNKKLNFIEKNFHLLSIPNKENNRYKKNENKNTINTEIMRCKSTSKFKLKEKKDDILLNKDKDKDKKNIIFKSTKLLPKLNNVFKRGNSNVNNTSKKSYSNKNNNFIQKYNIVPIVLPFIKVKLNDNGII